MSKIRILRTVIFSALSGLATVGIAENMTYAPHPKQHMDFFILSETVPDVIDFIAARNGKTVHISSAVQGIIKGQRFIGSFESVVNEFSERNNLIWFNFNNEIYFDVKRNVTTRIMKLGPVSTNKVVEVLTESGISINHLEINEAADGKALIVSGPPKLLGIIEALIASVDPEDAIANGVRIRRAGILASSLNVTQSLN